MHDDAPSHAAKNTSASLAAIGIKGDKLGVWPPCSPDLNPIENLWSIIKRSVYDGGRQFTSKQQLWEGILSSCKTIEADTIQNLTNSMDERVQKLLSNKGSYVQMSVMHSCSPWGGSALRVLILLTITFIPVSESTNPSVKVKLHDSATLPCSERCSGLVRWTVFTKPTDPLAECDQTSCRSVKEGYQMIHDQYLKGDLSLIITEADLTKRNWYTCACDGKDLCDVTLKIEPLNTKVQKKPGESLFLDLHIPEEVEMIYNSTGAAGPSSGQICTVVGRSLHCKPEYKQRTSLASTFVLRAVTPSDSGVYTVMDKKNEEAVHTYTVTIEDGGDGSEAQRQVEKPRFRRSAASDDQPCQGAAVPVWLSVLSLTVCGVLLLVIGWMWRKIQQLQKKCAGNGMKNRNGEETMSL
ncbi:hypothetical protein MHYP_G00263350 [Metynnis hypsauchen]